VVTGPVGTESLPRRTTVGRKWSAALRCLAAHSAAILRGGWCHDRYPRTLVAHYRNRYTTRESNQPASRTLNGVLNVVCQAHRILTARLFAGSVRRMTKPKGVTFEQAANALGVATVIREELQFLIDWGFTFEVVTPWMVHFICDDVVIRILRDPQGYEIVGDIADSRSGNWHVDFITARWIITGQRDYMIHAATREELIAGVEMCAGVLRDLGREMLVDRVSLADFVHRAREYASTRVREYASTRVREYSVAGSEARGN
jgi:hypothetical protein